MLWGHRVEDHEVGFRILHPRFVDHLFHRLRAVAVAVVDAELDQDEVGVLREHVSRS